MTLPTRDLRYARFSSDQGEAVARPRGRAKKRGYFDELGVRWLTVSEAMEVFNHVALLPISDATWRRGCRAGEWQRLGIRIEQPVPGYFFTDAQSLYEFLRQNNEQVRADLRHLEKEMVRERKEWEQERREPLEGC
jgi:hypothetical protein